MSKSRRYQNLPKLKSLCAESGIQLWSFCRGTHHRLVGMIEVDYWPGTDKAWKVGSPDKAMKLPVEQVVEWAKTGISP